MSSASNPPRPAGSRSGIRSSLALPSGSRIEAARRSLGALVARLQELPERTREIFILYRIENVPRRDIAQAYELSISTVEKEIARATAHLMLHEENSQ